MEYLEAILRLANEQKLGFLSCLGLVSLTLILTRRKFFQAFIQGVLSFAGAEPIHTHKRKSDSVPPVFLAAFTDNTKAMLGVSNTQREMVKCLESITLSVKECSERSGRANDKIIEKMLEGFRDLHGRIDILMRGN